MKKQKGITLISLVVTIVVLIILAGVTINLSLGENGIFNKAKEAKKAQIIANAKEQIGLEILEAKMSAIEKDKELEQSEVEKIVSKYGKLQEDKDTIILNDGGYEISLADIYNTMSETEEKMENATSGKILKNYKAYVDGNLVIGTMENYAGKTVAASIVKENGENVEVTIPQAGYYDTTSKISVPLSKLNSDPTYFSNLYLVGQDKLIRLNGIIRNTKISRDTTAVQMERVWFGSGSRDVEHTWTYTVKDNNDILINYAGSTDWAGGNNLYTVCTDCTLLQSNVPASNSGWASTHDFVCNNIPDGLTIDDLVIESAKMGIGSGMCDSYYYLSYEYNPSTKTVTITYTGNHSFFGPQQAINVYKRNDI